eukprot:XP_014000596.1 PREDICTED: retinol dehydrogenase 14-like [Salmo salar]
MMEGKTVIVTGTNSGIVKAVAGKLHKLQKNKKLTCSSTTQASTSVPTPRLRRVSRCSWGSTTWVTSSYTHLVLDLLKLSCPSRVVVVSSNLYNESSCNKAFCYSQSKLANLLFTCELTRRLEDEGVTGVMVNTLSPGMVRTSPLTASLAFFKSPLEGAWMPLNLACSPDMEGLVGKCFANCVDLMPKVMDDQSVKRLWDVSESMVGSRHSSGDDPRYFSL